MAICFSLFHHAHMASAGGSLFSRRGKLNQSERFNYRSRRNPSQGRQVSWSRTCCFSGATALLNVEHGPSDATVLFGQTLDSFEFVRNIELDAAKTPLATLNFIQIMMLVDIDPATAKVAIGILGPFFSAFSCLFILRIVMSWYPKLPVRKFPYVIAYAPTEPILIPTRKLIPPLGGVDVTPVVWFGLISFLNEILVGPQGLLVLLSQQAN